ncbi:hypothetical protein KKF81_01820 [Candidatus Micrarchaeota archaeon]|nr:hypothetical protein [Candidatus Micrarchaeota archaeon]
MSSSGKQKKLQQTQERVQAHLTATSDRLATVLSSKLITDRHVKDCTNSGPKLEKLIARSSRIIEDTSDHESWANDCFDLALTALSDDLNPAAATITFNLLAELWLSHEEFGIHQDLREISNASAELVRLYCMKTVLGLYLNTSIQWESGHPNFSYRRDPSFAQTLISLFWSAMFTYGNEDDAWYAGQFGKTSEISKPLIDKVLTAIKARFIANDAISNGLVNIDSSLYPEQIVARLECLVALYVLGDRYPAFAWDRSRYDTSRSLVIDLGWLVPIQNGGLNQSFELTPEGITAVDRFKLAKKPY